MCFHADLHIHSKYSRACSRDCDLEHLTWWARRKGVTVVGTGDFTHPAWFDHLRENLVPAEPGLFRLRDDVERDVDRQLPPSLAARPVRFMLSVEISTIYKRDERTRKIHHLVYVPDFEAAEELNRRLGRIGNLGSDGRPILGLDSRDLLEITLECSDGAYLVPAHVWTPWFAVLGSKSGFDAIHDCYVDLADHIFALETGLSSDPAMNWRISGLDRYRLVSSSDAHSPPILGRETTVFDTDLDYFAIRRALETGVGHVGSVEFFPEEGKYHVDGHRKCGVRMEPEETREHGGICPECGDKLTVGVLSRVEELADRPDAVQPDGAADFRNLVPLPEIMSEVLGTGPKSKKVVGEIDTLTATWGPELAILEDVPVDDVETRSPLLAEALTRLRRGEVIREAGFDGEYGVIRLFEPDELKRRRGASAPALFEDSLFAAMGTSEPSPTGTKHRAAKVLAGPDGPAAPAARRAAEDPLFDTGGYSPAQASRDDDIDLAPETIEPGMPHPVPGSPASELAAATVPGRDVEQELRPTPPDHASQPSPGRLPASTLAASPTPPEPEVKPALLSTGATASAGDTSSSAGGLDPEQQAAVEVTDGPLLIVAGPGTGKTRTLTHRIAHLVTTHGVEPEHCLALTFTRRAAEEMAERLARLLPEHASAVTTATFHSLGVRILREQHERVGLSPHFGIADETQQVALLSELTGGEREARRLLAELSRRRRSGAGTAGSGDTTGTDGATVASRGAGTDPEVADLEHRYIKALRQRDLVDFDDLVALPVSLLEDDPDLAATYRDRYRWISVDEYQDVDEQQYRLLRQLAPPDGNLTAIGDPDQAIYRFRGADVGFFLRFQRDFPGARTVQLGRNYRSSAPVVTAALQVVSPTTLVPDRVLRPVGAHGEAPVGLHHAATEQAEASFVARTIDQLLGGTSFHSLDSGRVGADGTQGLGFSDFAVLYRTDQQARAVMSALTQAGVPFQKRSHDRLADRPGVRWIVDELVATSDAAGTSGTPSIEAPATPLHAEAGTPVPSRVRQAADAIVRRLTDDDQHDDDAVAEVHSAVELLMPLAERAADDLEWFRTELALGVEVDTWDPRADRVSLLTLHAAKGLEFPVVFVVGCEDGLLPLRWPGTSRDEVEEEHVREERRLLFVGMTRSQRHLYLSHAAERARQGTTRKTNRSPYLADLDAATYQQIGGVPTPRPQPRTSQLRLL